MYRRRRQDGGATRRLVFCWPGTAASAPEQLNRDDVRGSTTCVGLATARLHSHNAEFDPGSGRTLATCLMHASRTQGACSAAWRTAEEHVGINPGVGDTSEKSETIPHTVRENESPRALRDEPAAHQVVGVVTAHQAGDGSLV